MDVKTLSGAVEELRQTAIIKLDQASRSEKGQFFTPWPVAAFMASLFDGALARDGIVRVLDAGAGMGALTAAFVAHGATIHPPIKKICATVFEFEPRLQGPLAQTLDQCARFCAERSIEFTAEICQRDFIADAVRRIKDRNSFLTDGLPDFDCAILNPPYLKMSADSSARKMLKSVGIETTNFYAAFVWLALKLVKHDGQMVAITPRSFCNGVYFRPFRKFLKNEARFRRLHVFDSRREVFAEDGVLQENIIWHVNRALASPNDTVNISSNTSLRQAKHLEVLDPTDPEFFVHIPLGHLNPRKNINVALQSLGLKVSTGRVVDFRAKEHLRNVPSPNTAPLLYPTHISSGTVMWPVEGKKPNAIVNTEQTRSLLIPSDVYVLVKRFSSKEERRRLSAVVYEPAHLPCEYIGIENHLNYIHANGRGIAIDLAYGLSAFLNSALADEMFRQFNGHTQVNATDLSCFSYPDRDTLVRIGQKIARKHLPQQIMDELVTSELAGVQAS